MRVVVVGGGIIGCSLAYFLRKAGCEVVLLERGEIGGEASGASAGMLIAPFEDAASPDFQRLQNASLRAYPGLIAEVQAASGIDVELMKCGLLRTAHTAERARELRRMVAERRADIPGLEWVEGDVLQRLEPALSPKLLGAAYSPEDTNLNAGSLTQAFAAAAERAGAEVRRGRGLTRFAGRRPRLGGVSTPGEEVRADAVILAAGPWTGVLLRRLGVSLPTPPRRGQILAYKTKAIRHAVWGDVYVVPKARGFLFAGATLEDVGFRPGNTARAVAELRRMTGRLVPRLRDAEPTSVWAGLRPGSPDDLPVLGRLPGWDNVFVASGHFRNGILLAPITGELMVKLIVDRREDPLIQPFRPDRFAIS